MFGDKSDKNTMSNASPWKALVDDNFVFTNPLFNEWHVSSYTAPYPNFQGNSRHKKTFLSGP
jgi:hypothetical protein